MPYLEEEIKKPEYNGLYIYDLWDNENEDLFLQALAAAQEARDRDKHITVHKVEDIDYPLDKINATVWALLENDTAGQVTINMARPKEKDKLLSYYAIDFVEEFNGIKLSKKLTAFDKITYIAAGGEYYNGNRRTTLTHIYYTMGGITKPSSAQLEKIYKSLTKMRTASIYLDNEEESQRYNYPFYRYEGNLLPLKMITERTSVNGRLTDAVIEILDEPPLLRFAKMRKQVTTISVRLLQVPLNKTEDNLQLMDYLLYRISRAKAKTFKILLDTLYKRAGITTKKQKQRAPEKISALLEYYREQGTVRAYKIESDCIKIILP
jgi:hypothetical protein